MKNPTKSRNAELHEVALLADMHFGSIDPMSISVTKRSNKEDHFAKMIAADDHHVVVACDAKNPEILFGYMIVKHDQHQSEMRLIEKEMVADEEHIDVCLDKHLEQLANGLQAHTVSFDHIPGVDAIYTRYGRTNKMANVNDVAGQIATIIGGAFKIQLT